MKCSPMFIDEDDLNKLASFTECYLGDIKESSCQFQDTTWKFLEAGHGEPVLLLHAIGCVKVYWKPLMQLLSKNYHVISPQVPGLSYNTAFPDGKPSRRKIIHWIDAFLDANNITATHIVGHGSGGGLAMYFAHSHPERVKTITWLTPPDLNKALAGKLEPWERAKKGFSSSEQAAKHKNSITHEPLYRSDVVNRGHNNSHAKAIHKDGLFQYFEKELQSLPLLMSKMRAIKQRALLVTGSQDPYNTQEWTSLLLKSLINSQHTELESCGHLCMLEQTKELANVCTDFLTASV